MFDFFVKTGLNEDGIQLIEYIGKFNRSTVDELYTLGVKFEFGFGGVVEIESLQEASKMFMFEN